MNESLRQAKADRVFFCCVAIVGALLCVGGVLASSLATFGVGALALVVGLAMARAVHQFISEGPEE